MLNKLKNRLLSLLKIESVTGKEKEIADYIESLLAKQASYKNIRRYENTIICHADLDKEKKNILLAGHMDTVPGHIEIREDNARVFGRGSVDMKAGLAVMLCLLENLLPADLNYNPIFCFYSGEEGDFTSNGLKKIIEHDQKESDELNDFWNKIALAFLLEPTGSEIQLGCQGSLHANIKISGKAGHSARPFLANNAIYKAYDFINKIKDTKSIVHKINNLEFTEVLVITQINTYTANNVIPGECYVNINHRFPPGTTKEMSIEVIKKLIPDDASLEIKDFVPSGKIADTSILADFTLNSGAQIGAKQAYTDVGLLSLHGIEAINFGPGNPDMCHTENESIDAGDLLGCYMVLKNFLKS
ncbi:MAG: succinyl-diaminopimelate desuccinylase [Pseudomonadota bacterium]